MSLHSDEGNLVASSDSFWEPGNYKRTTKRIEDGFRLCNDLVQLITERSDIEKMYAKSLRTWSKKWGETIEKGPEYGTTEAAWKGVLTEAERVCDLHIALRDRMIKEVVNQIKMWQKDNFHKSMMHLKEKKEMEDNFKKAQKPWTKLLSRVQKFKAEYHLACKNEKSAVNIERNASSDNSLSPDQIKKLQDRVCKCKEDVLKSKERYEIALEDLNHYNAKYVEDMTLVFERCQEMEETRLNFFKTSLLGLHGCLDLSSMEELPRIFDEYKHTILNADADKDLKWWSNNHGVRMGMNWPEFEEYAEDLRELSTKSKKGVVAESSIALVSQTKIGDHFTPEFHTISKKEKKDGDSVKLMGINANISSNNTPANNPFEEEEWEDDTMVDHGEPGVLVKALYDYEGTEEDELTFKRGEVFEKLEDEDEQGWCKGRKDNRLGLYPANYVELSK